MARLNEEAFAAWAPDASPWSVWVKPVLFAAPAGPPTEYSPNAPADARYPGADSGTAIVLDLPGRAGVVAGLGLAGRGYRPVPLYNGGHGPAAVVEVMPIVETLDAAAKTLARLPLADDAPPVFLLDADRMKPVAPAPGRFDNRWMVFPQDFPSAAFLRSRGIGRVLLVQEDGAPREDLAHVLLRWQQGGLELVSAAPGAPDITRPLEVKPPSRFRRGWYRALAAMGLRRGNVGGFGAMVPIATASSG